MGDFFPASMPKNVIQENSFFKSYITFIIILWARNGNWLMILQTMNIPALRFMKRE